ncbi:hypothetical protein JCM10450v2_001022 [Rhodotorula kratochvilovae]
MLAHPEAAPLPPRPALTSFSRQPSSRSSTSSGGAACTAEWAALLQRHEDGSCAVDMTKTPVDQPADLAWEEPAMPEETRPPPAAVPADGGDTAFAREFFRKEGYLPALRNPREEERRRVLRRYSLHEVGQVPAIDELAALARDVFDVDTVVVNVVLEDRTLFVSTSGWDAHELDADAPRQSIALTTSFCPHAMSKPPDAGCFQIPNTVEDWRFRQSPLVQDGKGPIGFFASSNIYLPASPSSACGTTGPAGDTLPVGSLCLIHPTPRPPLSERKERMLKRMSTMAANQFQLAFERERRAANDTQHEYLYGLLNSLIVWPSRNLVSSATDLPCNLTGTAREIQRQTDSDFAFILDMRGFNHSPSEPTPPPSPPRAPSGPSSTSSRRNTPAHSPSSLPSPLHSRDDFFRLRKASATRRRDASVHGPGTVSIMDVECGGTEENTLELKTAWESVINSGAGVDAIAKALAEWHETGQMTFTVPVATPENPSPALSSPLLGVLTPDVKAVIAVPVFDHEGEPMLYVVAGSRQRHFQYEETDERFVKSVGALLVAGMLQERILAADKAKQAFLSQVSHELRTPMFAIGSQLELIRTIMDPNALESVLPQLDVAEICLTSLREVLDDTLDVSKLNNGGDAAANLVMVELEALVIDVVKSCWHKAKRFAALHSENGDDEGPSDSSAVEQVDVLLRSSLPAGTKAKVDVGALKRVLINLFGNAIKFTPRGQIVFTVAADGPCVDGVRRIKFEVQDSGKGMSNEFLRDHLFVAFRQEDSFTNGAGLGVSIAESIVKRMGGTLRYRSAPNQGTTATVSLPLEGVTATDPNSDRTEPVTRNLSEELASLFDPQGTAPPSRTSPASSPTPLANERMPSVADASQRVEDDTRTGKLAQGAKRTLVSAVPADQPPKTAAVSVPDAAAAQRLRVLVVDDNPIARRILVTFLKTKKIPHAQASGGAQAVERFKEFRPNLVWCDVQMPDVDGIQATREMREFEEQEGLTPARIVAISGLDSTLSEHASVLSSGKVNHWLVKSGSSLRALADDLAEYTKTLVESDGGANAANNAGEDNVDGEA